MGGVPEVTEGDIAFEAEKSTNSPRGMAMVDVEWRNPITYPAPPAMPIGEDLVLLGGKPIDP